MNFIKNIKFAILGLLLPFAAMSCVEEVSSEATAVQTKETLLIFDAKAAPVDTIHVYADGDWMADFEADWFTLSQTSGTGSVEVYVTVEDNVDSEGALQAPRSADILFSGASTERTGNVEIRQKGDTYLGVVESTVTQVAAMDKETVVKIADATVVAAGTTGFVVTDGTTFMYVDGAKEVKAGDVVYMNGEVAEINGIKALKVDEAEVTSTTEVTYPQALDIVSNLDKFDPKAIQYVSIEGTLVGNSLKNVVGASTASVNIIPAHPSLEIEAVAIHKVVLKGYYVGTTGGSFVLVVTSYEDKGEDNTIGVAFPFKDDFSWVTEYVDLARAAGVAINDSVGEVTDSADGAANVYTTLPNKGIDFLGALRGRGYTDLNAFQKTIYLQDGYLKYGKTDCQSGLILPLMKIEGEQDIVVNFQWCAHISGQLNPDKVKLVVAIEGPGYVETAGGLTDAKVSDEIVGTQTVGQMYWMDASVKVYGATKSTFITIRPSKIGTQEKAVTGVFRYYLDNIEVLPASEATPANLIVEGIPSDNVVTFNGTPEKEFEFSVISDKDFRVSANVNWLSFDKAEGLANEQVKVKMSAAVNETPELRRGVVTIKSGTSSKEFQVIQSSAGQELAPFVSLVSGNSVSVGFAAGEFKAQVQANCEYEVSSDAAWLTVAPAVATKALVEVDEYVVSYQDNAVAEQRVGHIKFFNAKNNIETVLTVTQAPFETGIYFQDDFSWVAPWADAYVDSKTGKPTGDSVGENNASAPAANVYTHASHAGFLDKFAELGYEDLNAAGKSFYTQKYYLKFGKTDVHTGIKLPSIEFEGETATDVLLTFDWSAHMTGSGNIDKMSLVVELEGEGTFLIGTKLSDPIAHTQAKGELKWQNIKLILKGVNNTTRISIKPVDMLDNTVDQKRWHLDNVKVSKIKTEAVATWDLSEANMSTYVDLFGGTDPGTLSKEAGDGGLYIPSTDAKSKLTYVQVDKTTIDTGNKAARVVGGTGEPYVTGAWTGDYWLFDVNANIAKGEIIKANFVSRASGTGAKYWVVEYFNGAEWVPAMPTTAVEVEGATLNYHIAHNNTDNFPVEFYVTSPADITKFQVRVTALSPYQAKNAASPKAPNGGTIRLKGGDLSPVFSVVK